jgi:hypothetical protein
VRALALVIVLASCGPPPGSKALSLPAPTQTTASLASKRCVDGLCSCRSPGSDEPEDPPPAEGTKRFEFKIGSGPGLVWVTLRGGQQLYKTTETAEACFYVDLPSPGKTEVTIQGRARVEGEGVGAVVLVSEHSAKGWYDTFAFRCGFPGPCEADSLRDWKNETDALPRQLRDPCGSTKLRGASWETGRLPDGAHPDAFAAQFTLDVYPFVPKAGPGDCGKDDAETPIEPPAEE